MAFTVRKINDEPIVVFTVELPVETHLESFRSISSHITHHAKITAGPLFIIWNGHMLEPALSDILLLADIYGYHPLDALLQPNAELILVGTHPLFGIAVKKLGGRLGLEIPWFDILDEGLVYARSELGFYA